MSKNGALPDRGYVEQNGEAADDELPELEDLRGKAPEPPPPRARRKYTQVDEAIKLAAVTRYMKSGKGRHGARAEAAKEAGVSTSTFSNWVKEFGEKASRLNGAPKAPEPPAPTTPGSALEAYIEAIVDRRLRELLRKI